MAEVENIKVDDRVMVIDKINGHGFNLADEVTVYKTDYLTGCFYCTDGKQKYALTIDEIHKVDEEEFND